MRKMSSTILSLHAHYKYHNCTTYFEGIKIKEFWMQTMDTFQWPVWLTARREREGRVAWSPIWSAV
jgi:hypothetical protein